MNTGYLGDTTPKLGFGLMRLPMIGDEIDMEQTKAMVDTFMAKGFTYFDTAYVYINGKSEVAAREAIVKRYPRDSFTLATKLPLWDNIETEADMQRIFDESMERAGVEYFDYYLLHAMDKAKFEKADRIVYCRMSTTDVDEAQRFAAEESRTMASFIRAMYRRGVADYKAKRAALAGAL